MNDFFERWMSNLFDFGPKAARERKGFTCCHCFAVHDHSLPETVVTHTWSNGPEDHTHSWYFCNACRSKVQEHMESIVGKGRG